MDSATYRHIFGQITNSCVTYHYNFPSHNLLSFETLLDVSKNFNNNDLDEGEKFLASFPCYKQFPYTVRMSFPLFCGSGLKDHARKLVEKKSNWEIKLRKLRVSNVDNAIEQVEKLRMRRAVNLSDGLKKYIEHFHNDPEPMFSGNYNWLYTGGCLSFSDSFNGTILISADYLSKKPGFHLLQLNETLDKVECKFFNYLKNCSPVLQIKCKNQKENLVICVRQKNNLSLFHANRERNLFDPVKLWRKKVLNSKLLTCVDLKEDCEEVVLSDTNFDVHVFNVEGKKIYSYRGKKIASKLDRCRWSQVAFGDHGVYWAFKNCFTILDLREFHSSKKLEYNPTTVGEQCEEICSFVPSLCDSNFIYLSTTHSLLQVDLRNGQTVQKWTHMMKNSPQFMTNFKDDENEVLLLQSQTVGETSGIVNECMRKEGEVNFISRSLPCLLMGMVDSLNISHLNGVCLNPFVEKRVNFAVTGMQCLKNSKGEMVLLTKNGGGDIFLSRIRKRTSNEVDEIENREEVVERMKVYESKVENIPPRDTRSDHFDLVDMRHIGGGDLIRDRVEERPEIRWQFEELYSPKSLMDYRDLLAGKVLEVWGHGLEAEKDEEDVSVDHKVLEWMEKC